MSESKSNKIEVGSHNTGIHGQYKSWFLEYASYVILERAVPDIYDGLKPVQRRILHAMKEIDDGRLNKVANIIGQSMQFHPHGDASIGDALVNMGQKDLLLDLQGNWGDVRTGMVSAAPRYIEARLSKFALDVAFNAKTTEWQLSYDGRKNEPVALPMKFPLLLAHGTDGIAVGLATKILPHNFCEIIDAAIKHLRNKKFDLYPDFYHTGGMIDVAEYNDGKRGGKVKVRAHISEIDKKTLAVQSVPFGTTTAQLIDSVVKANDQGKIKIKKITDYSGAAIDIHIELSPSISADITIDALYKFTDCEVSISPNTCVIVEQKPEFLTVKDLLRYSVDNTKELLKKELEIRLGELQDKWHFTSLEKIFFEEKIYKELEQKHQDWETVLEAIEKAFTPFRKLLRRAITRDDILKLTEKPVRRIYKLDIAELNNQIKLLEDEIKTVNHHLGNLVDYTIAYYENLLKKYGKDRERKTEIKQFEVIEAKQVAIANTKVYINRSEGFIGAGLKKDEFLCECSDLDDIIVFTRRGLVKVIKVSDKTYIGKDIIYAAVFLKNDSRTTYNMIYVDGKTGVSYAKRFNIVGITRDKGYDLTKGDEKSKVHYFSVNANGEAELVKIILSPSSAARVKELDFAFETLAIKGRSSMGNQVTKYGIKTIRFKEAGKATLSGKQLWFDTKFGRLNTEEKGQLMGSFEPEDKLLVIYRDGCYMITDQEMTQRFEPEHILLIEKYDTEKIISAVYLDHKNLQYNIKRFRVETSTLKNKFQFVKDGEGNYLAAVSTADEPILAVQSGKGDQIRKAKFKIAKVTEIAGWKAVGAKLMDYAKSVQMEWFSDQGDVAQGELF